ncbi:hypothetical protein TNIN_427381, partial [Trichonephila inaurata madagascariensis]
MVSSAGTHLQRIQFSHRSSQYAISGLHHLNTSLLRSSHPTNTMSPTFNLQSLCPCLWINCPRYSLRKLLPELLAKTLTYQKFVSVQ